MTAQTLPPAILARLRGVQVPTTFKHGDRSIEVIYSPHALLTATTAVDPGDSDAVVAWLRAVVITIDGQRPDVAAVTDVRLAIAALTAIVAHFQVWGTGGGIGQALSRPGPTRPGQSARRRKRRRR